MGWLSRLSLESGLARRDFPALEMSSLLLITGNLSLRLRKGFGISALNPPGGPNLEGFPCTFPAEQGFRHRDEFAPDCAHRHSVCCCRESRANPCSLRRSSRDSAGFCAAGSRKPNRRPALRPFDALEHAECLYWQPRRFGLGFLREPRSPRKLGRNRRCAVFYNRIRRHSTIGGISPAKFEEMAQTKEARAA